ncbi:hypothetical protein ACFWZ5_25160, partial [Streptomyces sp. NPDC059003]
MPSLGIFGKRNDNSDLLHQVLTELAVLSQRVTDQQHAADQARQDATAAVTTGLAEIRAVVRDGLARGNDTIRDPLTSINTELVAVRAALNSLTRDRSSAEPAQPVQPVHADPVPAGDEPSRRDSPDGEHRELLRKAAGISAATLQAHRDTWAFIVEHAGGDRHFHIPGHVTEHAGTVTVDVSGL